MNVEVLAFWSEIRKRILLDHVAMYLADRYCLCISSWPDDSCTVGTRTYTRFISRRNGAVFKLKEQWQWTKNRIICFHIPTDENEKKKKKYEIKWLGKSRKVEKTSLGNSPSKCICVSLHLYPNRTLTKLSFNLAKFKRRLQLVYVRLTWTRVLFSVFALCVGATNWQLDTQIRNTLAPLVERT